MPSDKVCQVKDCEKCSLNNNTVCSNCNGGFYLSVNSTGCIDKCNKTSCKKCSEQENNSNRFCLECLEDFTFQKEGKTKLLML